MEMEQHRQEEVLNKLNPDMLQCSGCGKWVDVSKENGTIIHPVKKVFCCECTNFAYTCHKT